jgi:predicted nucleic acid-binding Zn ribbon protein
VRNKLKAPLPLREILQKALKMPLAQPAAGFASVPSDPRVASLSGHWSRLVGEALAANSRPARVNGDVLAVEVTGSVWANELHLLKMPLMEKLRSFPGLEGLQDVRCQIATRSASDKGLKTKPLKSFG